MMSKDKHKMLLELLQGNIVRIVVGKYNFEGDTLLGVYPLSVDIKILRKVADKRIKKEFHVISIYEVPMGVEINEFTQYLPTYSIKRSE